jgi:hypothetical protein
MEYLRGVWVDHLAVEAVLECRSRLCRSMCGGGSAPPEVVNLIFRGYAPEFGV